MVKLDMLFGKRGLYPWVVKLIYFRVKFSPTGNTEKKNKTMLKHKFHFDSVFTPLQENELETNPNINKINNTIPFLSKKV